MQQPLPGKKHTKMYFAHFSPSITFRKTKKCISNLAFPERDGDTAKS